MSQRPEENLLSTLPVERHVILRTKLLEWYAEKGRHWIPWKLKADGTSAGSGEAIDPYRIWIAEVMLQQTQLKTMFPYWEKWIKTFPTLFDLANADQQEVLLVWQGLGYYSRARRIHQSSMILLDAIGDTKSLDPNQWPKDLEFWIALPGIGRSTAGSIISSAFDCPSPILDGNVKRVFSRLIACSRPVESVTNRFWCLSEQLLDKQSPRKFNQALMDLGAMVCKPRNPTCLTCPWQKHDCIAYSSGKPNHFPVKASSKSVPYEVIGVGVVLNADGEVLIDQRHDQGLLGGLWEFPGGKKEHGEGIQETIARELREELGIEIEVADLLVDFEHLYSHKRLRFVVHLCNWIAGTPQPFASQKVQWVDPNSLGEFPFPAANAKMIRALNEYLRGDKSSKSH